MVNLNKLLAQVIIAGLGNLSVFTYVNYYYKCYYRGSSRIVFFLNYFERFVRFLVNPVLVRWIYHRNAF